MDFTDASLINVVSLTDYDVGSRKEDFDPHLVSRRVVMDPG